MDKLTFDEFDEYYEVKRNPITHSSPYNNTLLDFGDEELDFLNDKIDRENVWSLMDNDRKHLVIAPGLQYKNVIGYFVTKKPWIKNEKYALK